MKYLTLLLLFISNTLLAQENFKWDEIIDPIPFTKNDIYAKTKAFMLSTWKKKTDVVEDDDKAAGLIMLKSTTSIELKWTKEYVFQYTVTFKMKDNKARIIIENVYCKDAYSGVNPIDTPPILDKYPEEKGKKETGLKKDDYENLMALLRTELTQIKEKYKKEITQTEDDW